MPINGKITTLYEDKNNTTALFPRTKTSAVSDENNKNLNILLNDLNNKNLLNGKDIEKVKNIADQNTLITNHYIEHLSMQWLASTGYLDFPAYEAQGYPDEIFIKCLTNYFLDHPINNDRFHNYMYGTVIPNSIGIILLFIDADLSPHKYATGLFINMAHQYITFGYNDGRWVWQNNSATIQQIDEIQAQTTYTAMKSDTLLAEQQPVALSLEEDITSSPKYKLNQNIQKWYRQHLWTETMVNEAVEKGILTQQELTTLTQQ